MATTFHLPTRELTAATFGRGLWSASLPIYDRDGDGVPDARDRCLETANAAQTDTDGDGFGNACDADFNNDCAVNVIDLGLFRNGFFGANPLYDLSGDGAVNVIDLGILRTAFFATGDLDADFNGDLVVNVQDLGIMRGQFFEVAGPSCTAGT
ncbi:MAG: thrombospondin type 3 repeat-containing protein [Pseudomonadota bacterium]